MPSLVASQALSAPSLVASHASLVPSLVASQAFSAVFAVASPTADAASVFESGVVASQSEGVSYQRSHLGVSHYALQSGDYEFVVEK